MAATGKRLALIIGIGHYSDPKITRLQSPANDVAGLSAILRDPQIGAFETVNLFDQDDRTIKKSIEKFLKEKNPEDTLLLYFSGHGILDIHQNLYLATNNTEYDYPDSTAISAEFITKLMNQSRSRRQILILDCCYSGAFTRGIKSTRPVANSVKAFAGNGTGRVILTATDALSFAWENKQQDQNKPSLFTEYLIEGLKSGEADLNLDGNIDIQELHEFIRSHIVEQETGQKPQLWSYEYEKIIVARSLRPEKIKQLVEELKSTIKAGAWEEASQLAGQLESIQPTNPELRRLQEEIRKGRTAESLYAQAQQAYTAGNLDECRRLLTELLRDFAPRHSGALDLSAKVDGRLAAALLGQIEASIKHEDWKQARAGARALGKKYPDHEKLPALQEVLAARRKVEQALWLRRLRMAVPLALLVVAFTAVLINRLNPPEEPILTPETTVVPVGASAQTEAVQATQAPTRVLKTSTPNPTSIPLLDVSLAWQRGSGEARTVSWSPDGALFAAATALGVRIYDASTNNEIQRFNTGESIASLAFNRDGTILAIGVSRENVIRLINPQTGTTIRTLFGIVSSLDVNPGQITFSPDGNLIAVSSQYQPVIVWDVNKGRKLKEFPGFDNWVIGAGAAIEFSPKGDVLAYAAGDGKTIVLRDVKTWEIVQRARVDLKIHDLAFEPNGKWIAAGGDDFQLYIIDPSTGTELHKLDSPTNIFALSISPDGKHVATSGYGGRMALWDTSSWEYTLFNPAENIISVNSLDFSPDGKRLLSSCGDGSVRIWDTVSLTEEDVIPFEKVGGLSVAFSTKENHVATFSSGSVIRIWDTATGKELNKFFEGVTRPVTRMDMSGNGDLLALGAWEWNQALIWDVRTNSQVADIPFQEKALADIDYNSVHRVRFSPDQKWLAISGNQGRVVLWDIAHNKELWHVALGNVTISALAFDSTGAFLAVGGTRIYILDAKTGKTLLSYAPEFAPVDLAFSNDGNTVAIPGGGNVVMIDPKTGKQVNKFSVGAFPFRDATVNAVSFRAGDQYIATASSDGRVCIWEVKKGKLAACVEQFTQAAWDVKFSADGSFLAASSESGIFKVWKISDK